MPCRRNRRVSPEDTEKCDDRLHTFVAHIMQHEGEDQLENEWKEIKSNSPEQYKHKRMCINTACSLNSIQHEGDDLQGTSLLFLAIAFQKYKLAKTIAKAYPELISSKSESSGLAPFHLAVAFGNIELVEALLPKETHSADTTRTAPTADLLQLEATGNHLEGTLFMGKLPLSMAACQNNRDLVDVLITEGAQIVQQNVSKDNVCHSLVKFANCFPSKIPDVLAMLEYLLKSKSNEDERLKLMRTKNNQRRTVLQLTADFGIVDIYKFIMEKHLHVSRYDLAYEIRRYDITDMDKAALIQWRKEESLKWKNWHLVKQIYMHWVTQEQSVCESICSRPLSVANKLIDQEAILEIIRQKWESSHYWAIAAFLGIFHVFFLVFLCVTAVARSAALDGRPWIPVNILNVANFCTGFVSLVYLLFEVIVRRVVAQQPFHWTVAHHNIVYKISAILFAVILLIDCALNSIQPATNTFLVIALLPGSWYLLCFLRCWPHLGIYIVLINEALLYGLIPMTVLILGQIVVFSSMMHLLLLNDNITREQPDGFQSFGSSMLTMFRLMMLLTDVDGILDSNEAVAIMFLYLCYTIVVTILLVNALISILTNQFKPNFENRVEVLYVQKLSLVIFIEGLLAVFLPWVVLGNTGTYVKNKQTPQQKSTGRMTLAFRKVRSVEYEKPRDIEHERLDHYTSQGFHLNSIERLLREARKDCHLDRIEELLRDLDKTKRTEMHQPPSGNKKQVRPVQNVQQRPSKQKSVKVNRTQKSYTV